MIVKRYEIEVVSGTERFLDYSSAYRLYAALLEKVPMEYGELLHEQELTPLAQYLVHISQNRYRWHLSLFGSVAVEAFSALLESVTRLDLDSGYIELKKRRFTTYDSAQAFMKTALEQNSSRQWTIDIHSPTGFKSGGEYIIFPSIEHIVGSLSRRLSAFCEELSVEDEDALSMLCSGLKITGYQLRSTAFYMKGQRIPSFMGRITITANLSAPMMELWKIMAFFANFSGLGIKPALGMGGVECFPVSSERSNAIKQ